MNRVHFSLFVVTMFLVLLLSPSVGAATYDQSVEVILSPDDDLHYNVEYNLANLSETQPYVNSERVVTDLGDIQGTYYGPMFRPAEFRYYYNWGNEPETEVQAKQAGYYYIIDIKLMAFISSEVVMNGVSRLWLDVPMKPGGWMIAPSNSSDPEVTHIWFNSWATIEVTNGSGATVDVPPYWWWGMNALQGKYANEHFYFLLNFPMLAALDTATQWRPWNITLHLAHYMSDPVLYVTNERLARPQSFDWDGMVASENGTTLLDGLYESNATLIGFEAIKINNWDIQTTNASQIFDQSYRYLPESISLGYSFLFAESLGKYSLYGQRFTIGPPATPGPAPYFNYHESLLLFNLTAPVPTSTNGYLSIYLPLISEDELDVSRIYIELNSPAKFTDGSVSWFGIPNQTYQDFILFSTNKLVNASTVTGNELEYLIQISFNASANVTMLFKWLSSTPGNDIVSHFVPYRVYQGTNYTDSFRVGQPQYSASLTSGQWAQFEQTAEGWKPIGWYFPVYVYVGNLTSSMDVQQEAAVEEVTVYDSAYYWRQAGYEFRQISARNLFTGENVVHLVNALQNAFKAAALTVWEGAQKIYGWLKSGYKSVVETLKGVGEWIWAGIMKIWDTIVSLVRLIQQNLIPLLEVILILVALEAFIVVYGMIADKVMLGRGAG